MPTLRAVDLTIIMGKDLQLTSHVHLHYLYLCHSNAAITIAIIIKIRYGDAGVAQHSGYIPVENGQMFYWMFESRVNPETAPLVVWFTGGPGW